MLVGIETHVCLLQTALELLEEGKEVYVVADAVGSRRAADRDLRARADARRKARGSSRARWSCSSGCARPATPLFREVSREFLCAGMNIIAILAALGLEQWRAFHWRAALERLFVRYARTLERKLNGGTAQQGMVATLATLAPPVLARRRHVLARWTRCIRCWASPGTSPCSTC